MSLFQGTDALFGTSISMKISKFLEKFGNSSLRLDPMTAPLYERTYPLLAAALSDLPEKTEIPALDEKCLTKLDDAAGARDREKVGEFLKDMLDAARLWSVECGNQSDGHAQGAMRRTLIGRIDVILSSDLPDGVKTALKAARESLQSMFLPRNGAPVRTLFLNCMRCLDRVGAGDGEAAEEFCKSIRQWREMS